MSLFLGPIHHIMFGKIKFQEGLCDYIIDEANKKTYKDFKALIDEKVESLPQGQLEDIVDQANIHGSLQSMIAIVEKRLACIVDIAEKENIFTLEEIKDLARQYGRNNSLDKEISLEDSYAAIFGKMLNGMPCDRVEEKYENDENHIKWRDRIDIHSDFWNAMGRSSQDFYQIRSAVIEGLFENTGISYSVYENNEFELRRK
ncbi:hypothetical protein [Peptostreptococcus equinus]|uniref:Uncharacterized protein n=1 Tax=Peptostreptococcus equinus TaxID=3003601 RepID=A0ABY7JNH2_9FIRM|nr:hypothetical protein [Peptostreptococcus sp. CBA3647]WAW14719.1 hypothetical protein O0R46_09060 [Peptostreptococcus sp. CBA3647]